jgi:hypothetical protein
MTRTFDLGDVLTITTGALVSARHVDGIYDILNYMTGDNLFTHQLPRAMDACAGPLLDQHPQLASVVLPDWPHGVTAEVVHAWVDEMRLTYGDSLPVAPLSEWHHVDPLQEMVEMTERPDRVIPIYVA